MSANSPFHPLNLRTRAQLAAAAPAFDINHFLATLPPPTTARQPVPNPTKARQTVPDSAPAQNKPAPATHFNPPPPSSILNPPFSPSSPSSPPPSSPSTDQPAPNSANARQDSRRRKTNPTPRPPRPLTADQLRAVSFLVDGLSTNTISHALCINRHTLARWKRHPLFQQELRRFIRVPLACR